MKEKQTEIDGIKEEDKKDEGDRIETESTKGHVQDIAPGCMAIELPCGYIHGEDKIETTAIIKEMTGYEEDILIGKGPLVIRLNAIIGNCLVHLGGISDVSELKRAANNLTAKDRMAVLLGIRRVSLGDYYDCNVVCPECKVGQRNTLNLKEIEIIPMSDRMKRDRTEVLPSGTEVSWHVLKTEDEEWLSSQKKNKHDALTLGLLSRVDMVGDTKLDRDSKYRKAISLLKGLSIRDRNALRNLFESEEGIVDTNVEFECDECKHVWNTSMDIGQSSFFFPSAK